MLDNKSIKKKESSIIQCNKELDDTIVNYVCSCKKSFKSRDNILFILPCNHMIHDRCFNEFIINKQINSYY